MARHPKLLPVSIDKEAAWPGPQACSHMFWMILQAVDEFPHWLVLVAYLVHSCEQRELVHHAFVLEDTVQFPGCLGPLQLLSIQHLFLQLLNGLSCAGEGLGHLPVPPSVAGSDEVSNTAALQEGGRGHGATAEELGEGDHLHESQSDHSCLGVVAKAQAITEASPNGHYIL